MNLVPEDTPITDLTLLMLVDIAAGSDTGRRHERLTSMLGGASPTKVIHPLIELGLVESRRLGRAKTTATKITYQYTITPRGETLARDFLTQLKNAAAA